MKKFASHINIALMTACIAATPMMTFAASDGSSPRLKYILFGGIAIAMILDLSYELKRRK